MKHHALLWVCLAGALQGCAATAGRPVSEASPPPEPQPEPRVGSAEVWAELSTPEAAAEELFRSYITLDAERFRRACARPFGDGRTRDQYARFIEGAAAELRRARGDGEPPAGAPVGIVGVHGARELPATYRSPAAYDLLGKHGLRLVAVDAVLDGRGVQTSRVLVVQDATGRWGALPRPELFALHLD